MANTVNVATISTANTFDHWRIRDNLIADDLNEIARGNFIKEKGNVTLTEGKLTLANVSGGVLLDVKDDARVDGLFSVDTIESDGDGHVYLAAGDITMGNRAAGGLFQANINTRFDSANVIFSNSNIHFTSADANAVVRIKPNTTFQTNANINGTLNVASNIANVGNLLVTQNSFTGNLVITQNTLTGNVVVTTLANISTANIITSNIATLNVEASGALANIANANIANIAAANAIITDATITTANVSTINSTIFITSAGLNVPNQANAAREQANAAREQANVARNTANLAYDAANVAQLGTIVAQNAYIQANNARDQANSARDQANTSRDQANTARDQANTARTTANDSYGQANTARDQANTARTTANAAANTVATFANGTLVLASGNLNFNNTASINIGITANGATQTNVALTVNANSITQLGTLTGLNVSGTANVTTIRSNDIRIDGNSSYFILNGNASFNNLDVKGNTVITGTTVVDSDTLTLRSASGSDGDGVYRVKRGSTGRGNAELRFLASANVWQATANANASPTHYTIITTQNVVDSVVSTSTTGAAAPNSVKTAYDQATNARDQANTARTQANNAYIAANNAGANGATTGGSSTLSVGQTYHVTSSGQTITLPASPATGALVRISVGDFINTTVARNSVPIMGLSEDLTIDRAYIGITLVYTGATHGWRIF